LNFYALDGGSKACCGGSRDELRTRKIGSWEKSSSEELVAQFIIHFGLLPGLNFYALGGGGKACCGGWRDKLRTRKIGSWEKSSSEGMRVA
jgi:hypothetical protein